MGASEGVSPFEPPQAARDGDAQVCFVWGLARYDPLTRQGLDSRGLALHMYKGVPLASLQLQPLQSLEHAEKKDSAHCV